MWQNFSWIGKTLSVEKKVQEIVVNGGMNNMTSKLTVGCGVFELDKPLKGMKEHFRSRSLLRSMMNTLLMLTMKHWSLLSFKRRIMSEKSLSICSSSGLM